MIKKVLIANRGECALAILRTARELGIETLVVYSKADEKQSYIYLADEAVCIGDKFSKDTYLNMDALITCAVEKKCDAIHPGYGFLSESYEFAKRVTEAGLKFIGPSYELIKVMSDKVEAKNIMAKIGVPLAKAYPLNDESKDEVLKICKDIGYPLLLKARSGGGGKGMRRVDSPDEIFHSINLAKAEAKASFGDESIFIEKLIENPRHIEVQILSDGENVIHLFERECSLQRNNQKILEEAPCDFISKDLKKRLYEASLLCAKTISYTGAGTIEYLVDKDEKFYFCEMNTRLQVEHAVTEMITGVDIIKEQFRIASGLGISIKQEDVKILGHAIEVRINAIDPVNDFRPSSGRINFLFTPGGVDTRFESSIYKGFEVPIYYDSMIGKIIVKDKKRLSAIKKLRRAIEETMIGGIETNLGFMYGILLDFDFIRGNINTNFVKLKEKKILDDMKEVSDNVFERS